MRMRVDERIDRSRYGGLETKQKALCYVFIRVYVNFCTVAVIELISLSEVDERTGDEC
jgi:hypothetical protein